MDSLRISHVQRMEKFIAKLRLTLVLLTAAVLLDTAPAASTGRLVEVATWCFALVYAALVVQQQPYHRLPLMWWEISSGVADWTLITLAVWVNGGVHSELYVLYFLSVLSVALRFGLREVVIAGIGTAVGYFALALATADSWATAVHLAGLRMGYLMLVAVGSGVLAREVRRESHARVREEARRLAVQNVTAAISHDLTNPLAAVAGMVEMLLQSAPEGLSLDQRGLLHRIDANTQQMMNLVSNLLDAELIERGQQSFRPTLADLNALVRRLVEAQAHQAESKGIGLVLDLDPRLPQAMVDVRMLERLVANLLTNAVKFTPEDGRIRISTRQRGARVLVEVWDSGPVIPLWQHATVFEKFTRDKDSPGVGLGLYICKSIIDAHRGTISVCNSPDGGVAFAAELPIAQSASVGMQVESVVAHAPQEIATPVRSRLVAAWRIVAARVGAPSSA